MFVDAGLPLTFEGCREIWTTVMRGTMNSRVGFSRSQEYGSALLFVRHERLASRAEIVCMLLETFPGLAGTDT